MDENDQTREPRLDVGPPSQKPRSRYTGEGAEKPGKAYATVLEALDARGGAPGGSGGGRGVSVARVSPKTARCCKPSSWISAASPACSGARSGGRCSWWRKGGVALRARPRGRGQVLTAPAPGAGAGWP